MTENAPVLQVVVPLALAPLCVIAWSRLLSWLGFLLAAVSSSACAVVLALQVYGQGGTPVHYAVGGWPPPVGIELVIDGANVPVLLLLSLIAVAGALYAKRSVESEINAQRIPLFYAGFCLLLAGLLGMTVTGDMFNLFVFLEISSLSSYALIALGRRRRALLAAFQYLIVGTIGGTFLLLGIGLLYAVTGTLNMADMAERLPAVSDNRAVIAGIVFALVGLGIKIAMFPLHAWLPGAYAEAPSAVSLVLSATGTKVALYALLRVLFGVIGVRIAFDQLPIGTMVMLLGAAGMVVAAAIACFQTNLKRMLAWSSISQIGYIVVGFGLATAAGVSAAYLHLINHGITKAALFGVAGILMARLGSTSISAMPGLRRREPLLLTAFVLAGLGLIGVPPTAGFVSKWALVQAMVEQGQWLLVVVLLASSLLAMVYVGRVVEIAWFGEPDTQAVKRSDDQSEHRVDTQTNDHADEPAGDSADGRGAAPKHQPRGRLMSAVTCGLVLLTLAIGVAPDVLGIAADTAAEALFGGGS